MLAYFESREDTIHLIEENLPATAELSPEFLRVLLIHEVTHAFDWSMYPELARRLDAPESAEQMIAAVFVSEGHAQWITHKVAQRLGLESAFDRFNAMLASSAPGGGYQAMADLYTSGPAWIQDRFEEGGIKAVESGLRKPPGHRP